MAIRVVVGFGWCAVGGGAVSLHRSDSAESGVEHLSLRDDVMSASVRGAGCLPVFAGGEFGFEVGDADLHVGDSSGFGGSDHVGVVATDGGCGVHRIASARVWEPYARIAPAEIAPPNRASALNRAIIGFLLFDVASRVQLATGVSTCARMPEVDDPMGFWVGVARSWTGERSLGSFRCLELCVAFGSPIRTCARSVSALRCHLTNSTALRIPSREAPT